MAGLKDAYKKAKSDNTYKDVLKNEIKKTDYYASKPISSLRPEKKEKINFKEKTDKLTKLISQIKSPSVENKAYTNTMATKVVYSVKAKSKIIFVTFAIMYLIFLIYGVSKTSYQYNDKGYSVPVSMSYSDIKKAEDYKMLLNYYIECKYIYEKVLKTDYKLAQNNADSLVIATEYESILDEIDTYLTQLDATSVKSEYSLLKTMLRNWCANDIAIYLQNVAQALTTNNQSLVEKAITYRSQSKVDFNTITENYASVGKSIKGIDVTSFEDWTADNYYNSIGGN